MKQARLYGVLIEYPNNMPLGIRYMDIKDKPMCVVRFWHIVGGRL